ncbi:glycoside hydrolase family 9 protein [Hellea sp.]|nr:glycoside hydrolase family 9 protein [Hellea sp.]
MLSSKLALFLGASAIVAAGITPVLQTTLQPAPRPPVIVQHPAPSHIPSAIAAVQLTDRAAPQSDPVNSEAQSGDILVNQHGFILNGPKRGVLVRSDSSTVIWRLRDAANSILLSGRTTNFGFDALSGQSLHHIDFSPFNVAGEGYRLQVGSKFSEPFSISERPYEQLAKDSLSYYYLSRAAEPVIEAYAPAATPPLTRAAGHVNETVSCFTGDDDRGTNWPSCGYSRDVSGGWYDAGDYGKYTVSNGITSWSLLSIAERRKQAFNQCAVTYHDGQMLMPENQNGVNDLLDEARRGIEQMLKMQITDTTPVAVTLGDQPGLGALNITQINAAGLVHHKVHGQYWPPDLLAPADDNIPRALYPPSTQATLHLAAVGAKCARHYQADDPDFAAQCLTAAQTAYSAAKAVPNAYAHGNFAGGGGVTDGFAGDEFAWAATELFLTTGEAQYQADIQTYQGDSYNTSGQGDMYWGDMQNFGMLALVRASLKRSDTSYTDAEVKARRDVLILADAYHGQSANTGYGIPRDVPELYWGSNAAMLYRAMVLAHAYEISGETKYYDSVVDVMDYLLGRNPLSQSYIAGYGEQAMERPHHRFWANVRDGSFPKPPAGAMAGGPNNTAMIDPIAQQLEGNCTGLTCYTDHEDAYSLNEVSIIWNGALVWVSNWLDAQSSLCLFDILEPELEPLDLP